MKYAAALLAAAGAAGTNALANVGLNVDADVAADVGVNANVGANVGVGVGANVGVGVGVGANVGANIGANVNGSVITEVVQSYVTFCPGPTQFTYGTRTYSVSAATTLTITDCPCTVTKPVITSAVVVCHTCNAGNFPNNTATGYKAATQPAISSHPTTIPTAGAGKAAALSGAGLAVFVGFAAFVL